MLNMTDDLRSEHLRNRLCGELRSEGLKLWLAPFVEDDNPNLTELQALAEKYSNQLKISLDECKSFLLSIQKDALEKLKERNHLSQSKRATLRIRCKGFLCDKNVDLPGSSNSSHWNFGASRQVKIEIPLTVCGRDLEHAVLNDFGRPELQLKFISDGKVLKKDESLMSQGITNSSRIMALVLTEVNGGKQLQESESHHAVCNKTRSAVSTLLDHTDDMTGHELEMENQQGCSLNLDVRDKKSLVLAMTLHERGRAAMNRHNYPLALVLLADADQQFKQCNMEVLENADNLALLNLDIVWCYLCLRSVSHIADAERRLQECEAQFERSYGKTLERVIAVKGSAGNEAALLARLHLLQGIVFFHQNKIDAARRLLEATKAEIKSLKVSQEDINKVVLLGFSPSEALMGLRASLGNIDVAVERIIQDQTDRKSIRKENAKKRAYDRERRRLGKTADGSEYIEPESVQKIVNMGFDRDLAICALKHSKNSINQAIFLIQEQPHLLNAKKRCKRPSSETIAQFAALGFDADVAFLALQKHSGNIERAVDDLISNNGIIECSPGLVNGTFENMEEEEPETTTSAQMSEEQQRLKEEEDLRVAEATEELEKDLSAENDDYLNITLEMEEEFLLEYLSVLQENSQ